MRKKYLCLSTVLFCFIAIVSKAQYANTSLSNLASLTKVKVNLLPDSSNKHSLGNSTKFWNNIYFDSAIYFDSIRFITAIGNNNTAIGGKAMYLNRGGSSNTAAGAQSLYNNLYGTENTAVGFQALYQNINSSNTAIGCRALYSGGLGCTGTGYEALYSNNNGGYGNTADGYQSLHSNTSGQTNTAVGFNALYNNTTGNNNVAVGDNSLGQAVAINSTVAVGDNALAFLYNGTHCTAVGSRAGYNNSSGGNNTYLGYHAGNSVELGSSNTIIGYGADVSDAGFNNATALGNLATAHASNSVRIGNSSVSSIGGFANWSNVSDGRIKKNVKQNVPGLSFINKLQPVTYNLDLDAADKIIDRAAIKDKDGKTIQPLQTDIDAHNEKEQIIYTGFIAQDVEKAAKSLNYDFSGVDAAKNEHDLYGLRYADFVVPLVKAVQELSKMNDDKDRIINDLEKRLARVEAIINGQQLMANNQQSGVDISSASLQQNIPNPFINTTTINYVLPQTYSSARIIITDEKGDALKQMNLSGSKGSVDVNGSMLAPGAYQYTLYIDGKFIDAKQMQLLK
jgi:hypothetical protein